MRKPSLVLTTFIVLFACLIPAFAGPVNGIFLLGPRNDGPALKTRSGGRVSHALAINVTATSLTAHNLFADNGVVQSPAKLPSGNNFSSNMSRNKGFFSQTVRKAADSRSVPESGTLSLIGGGLLGLAFLWKKRLCE